MRGDDAPPVPEVLFVCIHNAGRSQMAAGLLDHRARFRIASADCGQEQKSGGAYAGHHSFHPVRCVRRLRH